MQTGGCSVLLGRNTSLGRTDSAPSAADSIPKPDREADSALLQGGLLAGTCSRAYGGCCRKQHGSGMLQSGTSDFRADILETWHVTPGIQHAVSPRNPTWIHLPCVVWDPEKGCWCTCCCGFRTDQTSGFLESSLIHCDCVCLKHWNSQPCKLMK